MSDILCNLCGQSCSIEPEQMGGGLCGLINAKVSGGYHSTPGNGSGALDDGVEYKFSLCEFCLDWLFSSFVIPVEVNDGYDPPQVWNPAMNRMLEFKLSSEDQYKEYKQKFYDSCFIRERNRKVFIGHKFDNTGQPILNWNEYRSTHDLDGNPL